MSEDKESVSPKEIEQKPIWKNVFEKGEWVIYDNHSYRVYNDEGNIATL